MSHTTKDDPTAYLRASLPAVRLVQYTAEVGSMAEIGPVVGPMFERLLSTVPTLGLSPDDPSLAWYDSDEQGVRLGVGMPAPDVSDADAARAGMEIAELPAAARAVQYRFAGSLEGLQSAWAGIHETVRHEGLTPIGPCREVYVQGSVDSPDGWVVDLQQPVA